jgi:hypothetical protein
VIVTVHEPPVTTALYETPDADEALPHQHDGPPPASAPPPMMQHSVVAGDVTVSEMQAPSAIARINADHACMTPPNPK